MATLEDAFVEATKNNCVCPLPDKWNRLYKLLPNRRRNGSGLEPALPLILASWHDTAAILKAMRLKEHIEWAAANGALDKVHDYIVALPERAWHHYSDE